MTLQEAYQLLKKEHAAVKKELAAYQKASFPLNEKEELEKELRKGERRYASLEKQFQELADLHISDMQAIRKLQASLESEQILAISLKEQNSSLLLELEKIRAERQKAGRATGPQGAWQESAGNTPYRVCFPSCPCFLPG